MMSTPLAICRGFFFPPSKNIYILKFPFFSVTVPGTNRFMLGIGVRSEGHAITAVALIDCVVTKRACKMSLAVKYVWCQRASDVACGDKKVKIKVPRKRIISFRICAFSCW